MQYDLRTVGLRHEIRRPMGKRRHLVGFTVTLRRNNHRNRRIGLIRLYMSQEGIAVHDRHDDVQQDQ